MFVGSSVDHGNISTRKIRLDNMATSQKQTKHSTTSQMHTKHSHHSGLALVHIQTQNSRRGRILDIRQVRERRFRTRTRGLQTRALSPHHGEHQHGSVGHRARAAHSPTQSLHHSPHSAHHQHQPQVLLERAHPKDHPGHSCCSPLVHYICSLDKSQRSSTRFRIPAPSE